MIKVLLVLLIGLATMMSVMWLIAMLVFSSEDHADYDSPLHPSTGARTSGSIEHNAVAKLITDDLANSPQVKGKAFLKLMREQMDQRGAALQIEAEVRPVNAGGVKAEWVIAANAEPNRRLLYIHGGAYMIGSPISHRGITNRLSKISNAVVLSIDYSLMPENPRMAGIEDCRSAYRWLLENGPDGSSSAETLIVAGDSSGGNLALSTIAWARDSGLRSANAVIALSPQTDATLESPSLKMNIDTDIMQGASFGPVIEAPRAFTLWVSFFLNRINPSDPLVSPLLGDLSNLPPTLLQVSEAEMFLDDSVRYVNKANAQGSIAILQSWPFLMHVWHAFDVPEADEAFAEIEQFLATYAAVRDQMLPSE